MKKNSTKLISLVISLLVIVSVIFSNTLIVGAEKYDPNTDFIAGKYGVFLHYLSERFGGNNMEAWNKAVDSFNVEKFAADMDKAGASWVTITLTQSNGFFCIPMPEMETATGIKCGSNRDLVADLIKALKKYDIKLMLYWTPGLPPSNNALAKALGAEAKVNGDASIGQNEGGDWKINYTAAKNVCTYLSAVSKRYGEDVIGWWFDGCYDNIGFNERVAELYANAAKSGNKNTLVAFNQGTKFGDCRFPSENYSCGETCHPNRLKDGDLFTNYSTKSRWTENGYQKHYLTFLGENWGLFGMTYKTDELVKHSYENILKNGGSISFDVGLHSDGTVDKEHLSQLVALNDYLKKQPEIKVETVPENIVKDDDNASSNTPVVEEMNTKTEIQKVNYNIFFLIGLSVEVLLLAGIVLIVFLKKKQKSVK